MYQIPAQVLAIFCLPWAVQIVIMASRNVNLIHNKVIVYCQKIFITSELLISSNKNFCWDWCWVSHWTCCEEYHKNKDIHYHMAVNMTKPRRCQKWVKEQLKSKLNINVHFSDKSLGYFAAYRCIFENLIRKHCIVKTTLTLRYWLLENQSQHESQQGKKQCYSEVWWT